MNKFMRMHLLGLTMAAMYMNEAGDGGDGSAPVKTEEELAAEAQAAADKQADKERVAAEKKAAKEQEKADKKAQREKDLKAKQEKRDADLAAKKAEREASRLEQNGVSRPLSGATKQVWEIADRISGEQRRPAERKEVTEAGLAAGLQQGTIHTQYGRWRKYNGLTSVREAKPAAPVAPTAPTAPTGE